jgi:hypothetical protein
MAQSNWNITHDDCCLKADLTAALGTNKLRSIFREDVVFESRIFGTPSGFDEMGDGDFFRASRLPQVQTLETSAFDRFSRIFLIN